MGNLHELLQPIASSFHDVRAYRTDVLTPVLYRIDWRVGNEIRLEPIAYTATENEVRKLSADPAFGARDKMIFGGHHESIIVSLQINTAIDTPPLIPFEELKKFRLNRLCHVSPYVRVVTR